MEMEEYRGRVFAHLSDKETGGDRRNAALQWLVW